MNAPVSLIPISLLVVLGIARIVSGRSMLSRRRMIRERGSNCTNCAVYVQGNGKWEWMDGWTASVDTRFDSLVLMAVRFIWGSYLEIRSKAFIGNRLFSGYPRVLYKYLSEFEY